MIQASQLGRDAAIEEPFFRNRNLCVTQKTYGVMHDSHGLRQSAHNAASEKKTGPNIGASLPGSASEVPEISTKATGHDREQVPA